MDIHYCRCQQMVAYKTIGVRQYQIPEFDDMQFKVIQDQINHLESTKRGLLEPENRDVVNDVRQTKDDGDRGDGFEFVPGHDDPIQYENSDSKPMLISSDNDIQSFVNGLTPEELALNGLGVGDINLDFNQKESESTIQDEYSNQSAESRAIDKLRGDLQTLYDDGAKVKGLAVKVTEWLEFDFESCLINLPRIIDQRESLVQLIQYLIDKFKYSDHQMSQLLDIIPYTSETEYVFVEANDQSIYEYDDASESDVVIDGQLL